MESKVGNIAIDVNRMSGMIGGVTYDVHRGTCQEFCVCEPY
jgi:hypothetical protein